MQAFFLKQSNQKGAVGEARRTANSEEYGTTASLLLHSWAGVAWILVHAPSII